MQSEPPCKTNIPPFLRSLTSWLGKSSIGSRIARGAFWSLSGSVIARLFFLVASIMVAQALGKPIFGKLGMVQTTVGMFILFAGFSLGLTATKHVAQYIKTDPGRIGRIIGLSILSAGVAGLVMTIALALTADWLAKASLEAPELGPILCLASPLLLFGSLNGAITGSLVGFEAFKRIAIVDLFGGLVDFPLLVGGAFLYGLEGAILGLVISQGFFLFYNSLTLVRQTRQTGIKISLQDCRKEVPILWNFSVPAILCSAMVGPVNWICFQLLVKQESTGQVATTAGNYSELALFHAANYWRTGILFIPVALGHIVLPMLTELRNSNNKKDYKKVFWLNLGLNGGITLFAALAIWPLSVIIMASYGEGFIEGGPVLTILAFSAVLIAMNNVIGQAIASHGRMWLGFFFNLAWAVVLVLSAYLLLQQGYGAMGIALANLFAYFCHSIWQGLFVLTKNSDLSQPQTEDSAHE